MAFLLKFKPFEASSYYEFKDPDTGRVHNAATKADLVYLVSSYRSQNNLPAIENLDVTVENYLCHLPCNIGKCTSRGPLKRGFFTYIKGGVVLIKNFWYKQTVTPVEAERRALQCVKCPLNVFPDKSSFVEFADRVALASVGTKRTPHYSKLGNCAACTCVLNAKVWYKGQLNLTQAERIAMEGVNCWQLELDEGVKSSLSRLL